MNAVYDLVKDVYQGDAVIPINKRNTKNPEKLPAGKDVFFKDGQEYGIVLPNEMVTEGIHV